MNDYLEPAEGQVEGSETLNANSRNPLMIDNVPVSAAVTVRVD